ncbi:MAG: twin transmembrane helix small protein [Halopseudomonas sp.]
MFKLLLLIVFGAIVVSLFTALYFLITDSGSSQRTVNSLAVRVLLSLLLVGLLVYGFYSGQL